MREHGALSTQCAAGLAMLLVTALGSPLARADEAPANIATARALGVEGMELAAAGNCPEAVVRLKRAEQLFSAPTTLAKLGECQLTLGQMVAGTENLQRVVRWELAPSAPAVFRAAQTKARALLEEALPKLGRLRIVVSAPVGVRVVVSLDGAEVPDAMLDVDRPIDPGVHQLSATAVGYLPILRRLDLPEGARQTVALSPEPDPAARAPAEPAPAAPLASTPPGPPPAGPSQPAPAPRTLPYALLGVGAVGVGVGAVFGMVASGKKSQLDRQCFGTKRCPIEAKSTHDAAATAASVSTVAFCAGVGAAAAGAFLLFTSPAPRTGAAGTRVRIQPSLGARFDEAGVLVGGAF